MANACFADKAFGHGYGRLSKIAQKLHRNDFPSILLTSKKVTGKFRTGHEGPVHDVAYDYYGTKVATVSSDTKVKIYEKEADGAWKEAHTLSVDWAHPEFGHILASCSFDRNVKIWAEEQGINGTSYKEKCSLIEAREAVEDVKFAPHHMGLKVATCGGDGHIRIYEAVDVVVLDNWPLMETIETQGVCTSLSWNPSHTDKPMLVVGLQGSARNVLVYEYDENYRKWTEVCNLEGHTDNVHDVAWAPNLGRRYHLIASAAKDSVRLWRLSRDANSKWTYEAINTFRDHGAEAWRVNWNLTGTILASSGDDGKVRLWKQNMAREWGVLSVVSDEDGAD